jgi:hypothetical protein
MDYKMFFLGYATGIIIGSILCILYMVIEHFMWKRKNRTPRIPN